MSEISGNTKRPYEKPQPIIAELPDIETVYPHHTSVKSISKSVASGINLAGRYPNWILSESSCEPIITLLPDHDIYQHCNQTVGQIHHHLATIFLLQSNHHWKYF